MKIRSEYTCPLEIVHDIVKGKWKTVIMFSLRSGAKSLSALKRDINGISEKMLLEQLGELKKFGLVDKVSYEGYPLRVEYFLTEPRGFKMLGALEIMQEIGIDYMRDNGMEDILRQKNLI